MSKATVREQREGAVHLLLGRPCRFQVFGTGQCSLEQGTWPRTVTTVHEKGFLTPSPHYQTAKRVG
jgi:hypothetical protein